MTLLQDRYVNLKIVRISFAWFGCSEQEQDLGDDREALRKRAFPLDCRMSLITLLQVAGHTEDSGADGRNEGGRPGVLSSRMLRYCPNQTWLPGKMPLYCVWKKGGRKNPPSTPPRLLFLRTGF